MSCVKSLRGLAICLGTLLPAWSGPSSAQDYPTRPVHLFYDKLNYNFIRDIAPVASINRQTLALEVAPSFPAKTAPDFIAYEYLVSCPGWYR